MSATPTEDDQREDKYHPTRNAGLPGFSCQDLHSGSFSLDMGR
jgi:hypothetical protein